VNVPNSTIAGVASEPRARLAAWGRRGFLLLILLVIVAALCGFLGMKTGNVTAASDGYHLQLTYARIARPGMDVPWTLTITRAGGFDGPIDLEVTSDYFGIFESQGITPQPSQETADKTWWRMTFDKPSGDTLSVDFDIYVQPFSQLGRSGTARVLEHGRPVASVDFHTRLVP
jgi:hypothetical protein